MRLGALFVVTVGVVAVLSVVQSSAGSRSVSLSHPRVRTLAASDSEIVDVAQDGRYVAWLTAAGESKRGCKNLVVIKDLLTGRREQLLSGRPSRCSLPWRLALAGGRVYWELSTASDYGSKGGDTLWSASVTGDMQRRYLAEENAAVPREQPPVSDGEHIYFWSSTAHGSLGQIVRFQGLKRRTLTRRILSPAALAAGGGRFARATFPRKRDNASWPAWSPDGKEIAYVRGSYYCAWSFWYCDRSIDAGQLWLMNADGTGRHMIAARGFNPDWSPDGTKLAYGVPGDKVVIANADGSDPKVVTTGVDPAWSPDGQELAVQDDDNIWVVGIDGQNRRLILRKADSPDWSHDGSQLVFVRGLAGPLMIANADGSDQRSLGVNDVLEAAWSPDGSEIAYGGSYATRDVCEIRPDGTGKHCLHVTGGKTAPYYDDFWAGDPAWGPAPGELVFAQEDARADGDFHLVIWPSGRTITTAASPQLISVYTDSGRKAAQIRVGGPLMALAVSKRVTAALILNPYGGWAVKVYQPRPRTVRLPGRPHAFLRAAGTTLVFQVGQTIETLNALHGSPHAVATTSKQATGFSIFGRRIAWADHEHVRILDLPR
jgi:Tol biopolymer transport system component